MPPDERIATFDQDGTLWVEHPMYTFMTYALERVPALAKAKPELKEVEPFKTVLSGDREAMAKFTTHDLEEILGAALAGMTVDEFKAEVQTWLTTAKHPRWNRPYTELAYQPMLEVLQYLRANGTRLTSSPAAARTSRVWALRRCTASARAGGRNRFRYQVQLRQGRRPILIKDPKLTLFDDLPASRTHPPDDRPPALCGVRQLDRRPADAGIHRARPSRARLMMLVLHDDAKREYAYGPAQGLPDTTVGTFPQALYDEAKKGGWKVISMKNDWKRIFAFE